MELDYTRWRVAPAMGERRSILTLNRKHSNGSGARVQGIEEFPVRAEGDVDVR
jgi:hypothetical protein